MISISSLLLGISTTLVLYSLYQFFIYPFVLYLKLGFTIGFENVGFIYHPLSPYKALHRLGTEKYGHSFGEYLDVVKRNPMVKVIVNKIIVVTRLIVCDTEMIKKISFEFYKNLQKKRFVAFIDEMSKGLIFSEGEQWKNSRNILSNLFHFEKLKQRQYLMENVINQKISKLDGITPDLLKFGSSIGGQIVVKSLFGEEFFKIRFGENNPYQEMRDLLYLAMEESSKLGNIVRLVFFKRQLSRDCLFLTNSQKSYVARITKFKEVARQFLLKQKQRFEKGESISPFIEVYFKQKDGQKYIEEIIHQLLFFLFAGEDTTGSLIQLCLCLLATYPEYQQKILKDVESTSVHSSKELNNFINEVSRRHNVLTFNFPRRVVTPFEINGIKFQKGLEVVLLIGGPMINPKYWDHPSSFDPHRFSQAVDNPGTFIPFSSGPRNCIGQHMSIMEVRLTIVRILEKYRLQKAGNSLATTTLGIINHMADKHYVKFVKK